MQQGTREWIEARLGKITASRFADCLTNSRKGGIGQTALSYIDELVCEHLTRRQASTIKTYAMEWGSHYEPIARREYEKVSNVEVQQTGFVQLGTKLIGCSPDGLVGRNASIEIKCPLTPQPHLRVVESGQIPDEHIAQVQGQLWITGRQWCDFVSYHDHFPERLQLAVVRVERDDELIREIEDRVLLCESILFDRLQKVLTKMQGA